MTYERKIDIMVAAFCAAQGDRGEAWEAGIRKGLIDGFLRIRRLEMAEGAAEARCCFFPVERIQEGFGIWNSGGYDSRHGLGRSVAAAGMDGEKLRQIRYVAERNGRHSLAVVYPGCYIAVSVSRDMHDPASIAVYRVEGPGDGAGGVPGQGRQGIPDGALLFQPVRSPGKASGTPYQGIRLDRHDAGSVQTPGQGVT